MRLKSVADLIGPFCRADGQVLPRFRAPTGRPLHKTHRSWRRKVRPSHSGIRLPPLPDPTPLPAKMAVPLTIAETSADIPPSNRPTRAGGPIAAIRAGRPRVVSAPRRPSEILSVPPPRLVARPVDLTSPAEARP